MQNLPEKIDPKMSAYQYEIFLKYWTLGFERSLEKLWETLRQDYAGITPKKAVPSVHTLKYWSKTLSWQERIEEMDTEANRRVLVDAMEQVRLAKVDILKLFRVVVLKFGNQIKEDPNREITSGDVAIFWKMVQTELGIDSDLKGSSDRVIERRFKPIPDEAREQILVAFKAWGIMAINDGSNNTNGVTNDVVVGK